jgi:MoxR-like ATPase
MTASMTASISTASRPTAANTATPRDTMREVIGAVAQIIQGKSEVIELAVLALLAQGHLLIEDIPGVGKSTMARALAHAVGGVFRRVQFTSDLLPADVVGVNVWRAREERFEFRPGPLFANVVLADEINRAPPRTQSALLEAMGEGQISIDGTSHPLPRPFMVLATQNPLEHHGTYPLPESQRDRFLLRISMGHASPEIEARLLAGAPPGDVSALAAVADPETVRAAQASVRGVSVHADLATYAQAVVQATREHPSIRLGVSTRGALAWVRVARAHAFMQGRSHLAIDDLQTLAVAALAHRIVPAHVGEEAAHTATTELVAELVAKHPVPV